MASNSKQNLPLPDEKKVESKSGSGLRISAHPELNFNCNINPSDYDDLIKKPKVLKMLKKVANELAKKEHDYDDCRRFLPVKLLKEQIPGFDVEQYVEEIRQMRSEPEYIKGREDFINRFQDPPKRRQRCEQSSRIDDQH